MRGNLFTFRKLLEGVQWSREHRVHPSDVPLAAQRLSHGAMMRFCYQLAAADTRAVMLRCVDARRETSAEYSWRALSPHVCLLAAVCMAAVTKDRHNGVKRCAFSTLRRLCSTLPTFRDASKELLQTLLHDTPGPHGTNAMSTLPAVLLASTNVDFEFVTKLDFGRPLRQTAVMFCARTGNMQLLQLLVALGADLSKRNHDGHTAINMLRRWQHGAQHDQGFSRHHVLCWMRLQSRHGGRLLPGDEAPLLHLRSPFRGDPHASTVNAWGLVDTAQLRALGFFLTPRQVQAHVDSFKLQHAAGQAVVYAGGHSSQQPAEQATAAAAECATAADDGAEQWTTVGKSSARGPAAPGVISLPPTHRLPAGQTRLKFHMSNQHIIVRLLDMVAEALYHVSQLAVRGGFGGDAAAPAQHALARRLDAYVYLSALMQRDGHDGDSDVSHASEDYCGDSVDAGSVWMDDASTSGASDDGESGAAGSSSADSDVAAQSSSAELDGSTIDGYCRLQCGAGAMDNTAWMVLHQMCARRDGVGDELRTMCGRALRGATAHRDNVDAFRRYMVLYPMQHYCQLLLHQRNQVSHHAGYDNGVHDGRVLQAAVGAVGLLETLSLSGHAYFMKLRGDVCGVFKEWMHQRQVLQGIQQACPEAGL